MNYPGIDQSKWGRQCRHCGEPVDWRLVNQRESFGGGVKWVFFRAYCTANCRGNQRSGDAGLSSKKVQVPSDWPD